jgi:hypothetical protein
MGALPSAVLAGDPGHPTHDRIATDAVCIPSDAKTRPHVNVRCELAKEPLEYEGVKEMMFKVWWTLYMVDKEPEDFFILNSYTIRRENDNGEANG